MYAETASGGVTPRPLSGISRFFDGLELAHPGVVDISAWRPRKGTRLVDADSTGRSGKHFYVLQAGGPGAFPCGSPMVF